jgi:hypothetical protein
VSFCGDEPDCPELALPNDGAGRVLGFPQQRAWCARKEKNSPLGKFDERAHLVERQGKGLLAVDVLAREQTRLRDLLMSLEGSQVQNYVDAVLCEQRFK